MNNKRRKEILNAAKAANYQGSIIELFNADDQGIPIQALLYPKEMPQAVTPEEQAQGLRPQHQAGNTNASMAFPNVPAQANFNTKGMKAPINLTKFDEQGHLVQSFNKVPPGVESLPTGPARGTVIETPAYRYGGVRKYQIAGFKDVPYFKPFKNEQDKQMFLGQIQIQNRRNNENPYKKSSFKSSTIPTTYLTNKLNVSQDNNVVRDKRSINISDGKLYFSRTNEATDGKIILGGDYVENEPTSYPAYEFKHNILERYGARGKKVKIDNNTQMYYGIVDNKFKTGLISDFRDYDIIVPIRYGGKYDKKEKLSQEDSDFINKMTSLKEINKTPVNPNSEDFKYYIDNVYEKPWLDSSAAQNIRYRKYREKQAFKKTGLTGTLKENYAKLDKLLNDNATFTRNGEPIYNSGVYGKIILHSPSQGKQLFLYKNSASEVRSKSQKFLEQYPDAEFISMDTGRYNFLVENPNGLTKEDFKTYQAADINRGDKIGYNIIYGGPRKYQTGGIKNSDPSNDTIYQGEMLNEVTVKPSWLKDRKNKTPDKVNWYETLNFKNWGLNDYSDYDSFNSAFRNSRESGEKEFLWNKKRYSTELAPKEVSDSYLDSKKFLQDYYTNENFTPLDTSLYARHSLYNDYAKKKYGYTQTEYLDKLFNTPGYVSPMSKEDFINRSKYNDTLDLLAAPRLYSEFPEELKNEYENRDRNAYIKSLNNPDYYFSITSQPDPENRTLGYVDSKENERKMYVSNKGDVNGITTAVHELSHKADTDRRADYYTKNSRIPKVDLEKINKYGTHLDQERFNYVTNPSETEARKMSTLYFMNKVLGKNISSGKITKDDLLDLYITYNAERGYYNSKSIPSDVKDLLELYQYQKDDLLKYLNNDFSYMKNNEPHKPSNAYRYGGPRKYQYAGGSKKDTTNYGMQGMMKARIALNNQFRNNPAVQRMIVAHDNPYKFNNGNIGTHYMGSYGNYAIPNIQNVNGKLEMTGPRMNEAMRFDRPEDAMYFAENYKKVAPAFKKYGGHKKYY